ncbi:unnamed protein product [Camellia sinensis]
MNMGDIDYSMSTAGNVPNHADSTKTGKKGARLAEGIPNELLEMAKNLGSFIENTNTTMVEIAHRIGYSHDLFQQRRLVNAELLKLPMNNTQRLMATSMIVKDKDKVDLFFSLDENDKIEWVFLLLEGKAKVVRFWECKDVGAWILGTPTREEIRCMNPNYTEFKFPQIKAHPWHKVC